MDLEYPEMLLLAPSSGTNETFPKTGLNCFLPDKILDLSARKCDTKQIDQRWSKVRAGMHCGVLAPACKSIPQIPSRDFAIDSVLW